MLTDLGFQLPQLPGEDTAHVIAWRSLKDMWLLGLFEGP